MDTSLLESILDECRVEIQSNLERYGINASGRTSASLQVENYFGGVRLVSRGENIAPFGTLEIGASPKAWAPTEKLKQWTIDKGLDFGSDKERDDFVKSLQWKIYHHGTERHRNPNYEVTTPPIKKAVEEIKKVIPNMIVKAFKHGND